MSNALKAPEKEVRLLWLRQGKNWMWLLKGSLLGRVQGAGGWVVEEVVMLSMPPYTNFSEV